MNKLGRCDKCNKLVFEQDGWGYNNSSGKKCSECEKVLCSSCYGKKEMQNKVFDCCKECKKEILNVLQEPNKMTLNEVVEQIDIINSL